MVKLLVAGEHWLVPLQPVHTVHNVAFLFDSFLTCVSQINKVTTEEWAKWQRSRKLCRGVPRQPSVNPPFILVIAGLNALLSRAQTTRQLRRPLLVRSQEPQPNKRDAELSAESKEQAQDLQWLP
ncbi:hypothetical protein NDU88_002603 [Pleurodeles waltl]|uniref:Uncharacterized protein n=1 Tax=Pleurodeles waltl TaxID=8319 RepID=A0AAV7WNZ9_PLEWA|nr:hypothetical protein NDU88_002603 [Pleurodeles waltl]